MRTGIFYDKFDPIFFYDSIPLAHNDNNIDREYMTDMKNRLFYDQLNTTVGDHLILNLSRAITGDCTKKYVLGEVTKTSESLQF